MGNRRKAAAALVDNDETQADRELDEELDETLSVGDDDDDDLWDADGDPPADLEEQLDEALTAGDEEPAADPVAVADEYSAFVTATLPAKMKVKPLASQSNQWLLATIGRVVDEINGARDADRGDDEDIIDLELDLVKLNAAAATRGLTGSLSDGAIAVIQSIILRPSDSSDDGALPASSATNLQIQYIPRQCIHPDPAQPRAHADDELKDSIIASGILQPITVRPLERGEYLIVDGERRWQGAADVLELIPCIVRDDQEDEYTRLRTQLVANTGKALSPIEEAKTFARMLKSNDVGVAALARDIGRPPSTVNDRLKLLELGPWLEWIDNGSVSISMAVEHLVPLRGVPDEYHAEALAKLIADREPTPGEPFADSVDDFGHAIAKVYDGFMYPIAKSKNEYEKQPLFNTKAHDAECSCGGISWGGSWQGMVAKGRKFCGNPDWWKPLHAAAKKEERAAAKESGETSSSTPAAKLRLELPDGAKTIKLGYDPVPKDIVALTNSEGRWQVVDYHDLENAFDPADLVIDEAKLVRLTPSYGMDRAGTRDLAAVKVAREKFAARFAPARARVGKKLLAEFAKTTATYQVKGGGVHVLLGALSVSDRQFAEAADLLEIDVPDAVRKGNSHRQSTAATDWFAKTLKRSDAERLLSFMAFMLASSKRELPNAAIEKDVREAIQEIQKKRAPWATTKTLKKAAAK